MTGVDVAIVGGGVVGCAIARELSFSQASVVLLEAAHDVCEGASKGNTGIATSGADCAAGTLECDLVTQSSPRWEQLCATLDTPFHRIGTLAVALTEEQEQRLPELLDEAHAAGARAEIVSGEAARGLEPLLTADARAALHFPDDGIVDSIRLTIGYAELACRNGVEVRRSSPVVGVRSEGGRILAVRTPDALITARCVVNAAGLGADALSALAGGDEFATWPRKGQYWLLDREIGGRFAKVVGGVPTPHTRGIYAVPTTNRSLLLGPTAEDREDRADRGVDSPTLEHVFEAATRWCPAFAASTPSRRSPPTGRHPIPSTGSAATRPSRTLCTRRASARPASRRRRRWPSSCARWSQSSCPRPARTARTPSASWSRCRACSGTTVPSSCSTSIPATAR